jgi:predicted NBD/HSP70 family sugar kinase
VRTNPAGATVLVFEVLVDSIAAAVVGLGGETIGLVRVDRARGEHSVADVVTDLVALADRLHPAIDRPIVGIGVAIAGVVRRRDGLVALAPNLGWTDVPLGNRLARALGVAVPIWVANEADLGALAEHLRGAAVGVDDLLFVSGEVGVGGGAMVGGRPLTGAVGYAGEIGHLPVNPAGAVCRCGAVGCWETEIGERVLLARAGYPADAGRAGVEALLRDASAGSPRVLAALDELAVWLAVGLGGLVNILNPELIVLGGLHGRTWPFVRERLGADLARHSLPGSRSLVSVVPAALGADAPLVGAAELAFEPILSDPLGRFGRLALPDRLASVG